jgi:amino acid transporter
MALPVAKTPPPALYRALRATEYFTLAFGSMVGVGWMIILDDWLNRGGSVGALLGYLVGGVALAPVAYVYGRLAGRLPEAASEIAYTEAVFPRGVSFATGWAMVLTYLIVCPYEAVAVGEIAAYLAPGFDTLPLYEVGGSTVYLPRVLLGTITTAAITALNYRGIRLSSTFQNLTTFGLLAIFALFTILGLSRGRAENLQPYFAESGALLSTLAVLQIVPYFLTGFETIPKCSEEAAPDFDPRRFTRVTLLALAVGTFFYVTVIGVVALLQPWQELTRDRGFPTAVAFERAFGWPWLVQLLMVGVVLSLLKVYNGMFLAATRLLYALGRRGYLNAGLGAVHPRFQTPAVAVVLVGVLTALAALWGKAVLVPISEVGSLTCVAGWLATCLAFCRGAGGKKTAAARAVAVVGIVVCLVLAVIVVRSFGPYEWLAVAGWSLLGAALWTGRRTSLALAAGEPR